MGWIIIVVIVVVIVRVALYPEQSRARFDRRSKRRRSAAATHQIRIDLSIQRSMHEPYSTARRRDNVRELVRKQPTARCRCGRILSFAKDDVAARSKRSRVESASESRRTSICMN